MTETDRRALAERILSLSALRDVWEEVVLPADTLLFAKGDPGDAFYTVVEGELEVYYADSRGRKVVLDRLGPGSHVGELALFDGGVRSANVGAIETARLKRVRRDDFLAHVWTSPDLSEMAIRILSTRMRQTMDYLDLVTHWARQVARGDYGGAQSSIQSGATRQNDANVERFVATFTEMVAAVQAREAELKRELFELRIEIDEQKYRRQISEITDSDFFQDLQRNARRMRERIQGGEG